MTEQDTYRKFVQNVIDNIKKNGFPEKKVAFPLETMYEAAEKKGINFNKVLDTLDSIQIAHEKTPERIVFYPKDRVQESAAERPEAGVPGMDPGMFANLDPGMFANLNSDMFQNMNMQEMMAAASTMMQNMSPEQLNAIKSMYENMSDEEREALIEQVKKLGFPK